MLCHLFHNGLSNYETILNSAKVEYGTCFSNRFTDKPGTSSYQSNRSYTGKVDSDNRSYWLSRFRFILFVKLKFYFTFQIKYHPSHSNQPEDTELLSVSKERSRYTIKDLAPNTEYVLEVVGVNEAEKMLYTVNEIVFKTQKGKTMITYCIIYSAVWPPGLKFSGCPPSPARNFENWKKSLYCTKNIP